MHFKDDDVKIELLNSPPAEKQYLEHGKVGNTGRLALMGSDAQNDEGE